MEEANKKYDEIYNVYNEFNKKVLDFSAMSWSKLDASQLNVAADDFSKRVNKLGSRLEKAESMPPF
jgi:hypothetical protein